MLYCPACKTKVLVKVTIPGLMSYTTIINSKGIKVYPNVVVEDNLREQIKISDFFCTNCEQVFSKENVFSLLVASQYSGQSFKLSECCIISVLCANDEQEGNKVKLIVPPKIIGKSEIEKYGKDYNPYNDPKYLLIQDLDQLEVGF